MPDYRGIFLTLAFDDLVVAIGIAAEDAGGFSTGRSHLRRTDFKIVVQLIRLGQIKPLDDGNIAIVWNADRLPRRDIGLRRDRRGVDDQHIALPLADRVTVQRQTSFVSHELSAREVI